MKLAAVGEPILVDTNWSQQNGDEVKQGSLLSDKAL